jgi:alkylhydroperoxidase family enzyme
MASPDSPEGRAGRLGALYRKHRRPDGLVDNILRVSSLNPAALANHLSLYEHLMRGESGLSLAERELIAVAVSVVNDCHY